MIFHSTRLQRNAPKTMKEGQAGKQRRPHCKSRTGCVQCKQRKVKCDEQKPTCNRCNSYGSSCSYLQTHPIKKGPVPLHSVLPSLSGCAAGPALARPSQPPTALPANFTMLDLELLYFWMTQTGQGLVEFSTGTSLLKTTIVQMAFEHTFLMHEILSLAALHLAHDRPNKASLYRHASETHLSIALSLFQPQIGHLTPENCHACFAFFTLALIHAWASQDLQKPSTFFFAPEPAEDTVVVQDQWVKIHRASTANLLNALPMLDQGPFGSLLAQWMALNPEYPEAPYSDEDGQLDNLAEAWSSESRLTPVPTERKVVLDITLHTIRRIFGLVATNPGISDVSAVMSWPALMSDEYFKLVEEKVPEALLLVAHFCVLLKRLDHLWWMKGKAENLLGTVISALGEGWDRYIEWPIEQVIGTNDIAELSAHNT